MKYLMAAISALLLLCSSTVLEEMQFGLQESIANKGKIIKVDTVYTPEGGVSRKVLLEVPKKRHKYHF